MARQRRRGSPWLWDTLPNGLQTRILGEKRALENMKLHLETLHNSCTTTEITVQRGMSDPRDSFEVRIEQHRTATADKEDDTATFTSVRGLDALKRWLKHHITTDLVAWMSSFDDDDDYQPPWNMAAWLDIGDIEDHSRCAYMSRYDFDDTPTASLSVQRAYTVAQDCACHVVNVRLNDIICFVGSNGCVA